MRMNQVSRKLNVSGHIAELYTDAFENLTYFTNTPQPRQPSIFLKYYIEKTVDHHQNTKILHTRKCNLATH